MTLPLSKTDQSIEHWELQKFQRKLKEQGFPVPNPHDEYSIMVYVSGAITPTKACPDMKENRARIMRAALKLFLLGYMPYCPSVPWFTDPKKYNDRYHRILKMDTKMIADRCDCFYVCRYSRFSKGVKVEHPVAVENDQPIYYESKADKRYFRRDLKNGSKKKRRAK